MDKKYWVSLLNSTLISSKKLQKLLKYFNSGEKIWNASNKELEESKVLTFKEIIELKKWIYKNNPEEIWLKLKNDGIKVVTIKEKKYPFLLKSIYDPPPLLYYKGQLIKTENTIAIVGSRKATPYGKKVAEQISKRLSEIGLTIISGMARGIDSYSHKGALIAGKETIAVLGCGVDVIYPSENKGLYNKIIEKGTIISEFPPGSQPVPWHFPARNRIISGLSLGVIVVEAAEKSGALITTDYALEQGREVFSIPGPITSKYSTGTNNLIKQGAKLVNSIEDILEEIEIKISYNSKKNLDENVRKIENLNEIEKNVLNSFKTDILEVDNIVYKTGLSLPEVNTVCTRLEMKGLIKKIPGKKYIRTEI